MLDRRHPSALLAQPARWALAACIAIAATGACARDGSPRIASYDKPHPGRYGRINVRGTPPPVIYPQPVVARPTADGDGRPVYLYVPPGQVRKWTEHCAQWNACEQPVYFVRVDHSPSQLGDWKKTQRPPAADSPVLQVLNRFTS